MKNHSLYVSPWDAPQKKKELDIATKGIEEYHSEIFTLEKVKREDVPVMYRRSIKVDVLKIAIVVTSALTILSCVLFFATL